MDNIDNSNKSDEKNVADQLLENLVKLKEKSYKPEKKFPVIRWKDGKAIYGKVAEWDCPKGSRIDRSKGGIPKCKPYTKAEQAEMSKRAKKAARNNKAARAAGAKAASRTKSGK